MPAFNAERHIGESIQSVLDQTLDDWELIVVDDGSTDHTASVVGRFSEAHPRIHYMRRDNGGQAAARNTGIRNSKGGLIAFLDADDLWLPEKLERQMDIFRRTDADVVYCDGYVVFDNGEPDRSDFFAIVPGTSDGKAMLHLLYQYNRIATLSAVVRREVVEQAGLFDESRRFQNCEDYELWLRLARAGSSFCGMPDKLMRYRRHEASATHRESKMLKPMIEVVKKHSDAVDRKTAQRRIRVLYRELITSLISENDLVGARAAMREFASWDRAGVVTLCQRIVLRLFPNRFARISRGCLYPIEWHLTHFI
jgi:glycosyltransferase involved in cell wall biosynthesis